MVYTLQESQQFNTGRRRTGTTTMSTINKETDQKKQSKRNNPKKHPKKQSKQTIKTNNQRNHNENIHTETEGRMPPAVSTLQPALGFTCTVSSLSTSPTLVTSMDTATVSQD
jgi:hypothetical protein